MQNTSLQLHSIITLLENDEQYQKNFHLIMHYLEEIKDYIKKSYLKSMIKKNLHKKYTYINDETFALAKTEEGDILSLAIRSGTECGGLYYALFLQSENYTSAPYLALKSFCDTTIPRIIGCHIPEQIAFFWNYFNPTINFLHLSDKNTLSLLKTSSRQKIVTQHYKQLQQFLLTIKSEVSKYFIPL